MNDLTPDDLDRLERLAEAVQDASVYDGERHWYLIVHKDYPCPPSKTQSTL